MRTVLRKYGDQINHDLVENLDNGGRVKKKTKNFKSVKQRGYTPHGGTRRHCKSECGLYYMALIRPPKN